MVLSFQKIGAAIALVIIASIILYPQLTGATVVLQIEGTHNVSNLSALNFTVSEVWVHKEDADETSGWVKLLAEPRQLELISLQNNTHTLGVGQVPAARFDRIRVHFLNASATVNGTTRRLALESSSYTVNAKFDSRVGRDTILRVIMAVELRASGGSLVFVPNLSAKIFT